MSASSVSTYPIQVVARRTGLSSAQLRMWERRYPGIRPERDDSGRRVYPEPLFLKLQLISGLLRRGYRIGGLADLDLADLESMVRTAVPDGDYPGVEQRVPRVGLEPVLDDAVRAAVRLDELALTGLLEQAILWYGALESVDRFLLPLTARIEVESSTGRAPVASGALVQGQLMHLLSARLQRAPAGDRPRLAVAVAPGGRATAGAVASMLHAEAAGWYPVLLSEPLEADQLIGAVSGLGADALLVVAVGEDLDRRATIWLRSVCTALAERLPVLIGGRMPEALQRSASRCGGQYVHTMQAFRAALVAAA